jgi:hypothetical protein
MPAGSLPRFLMWMSQTHTPLLCSSTACSQAAVVVINLQVQQQQVINILPIVLSNILTCSVIYQVINQQLVTCCHFMLRAQLVPTSATKSHREPYADRISTGDRFVSLTIKTQHYARTCVICCSGGTHWMAACTALSVQHMH